MRNMILCVVMVLISIITAGAQTTKVSERTSVEGKSYSTKTVKHRVSEDILTDYTWSGKDNVSYPIYLHKITRGDNKGIWTCYVLKVSNKTSKEYKYYIPDAMLIASDIIKKNPNIINK